MEQQILQLQREIADLRFLLHRKTSGGSADIKGNITNPSSVAATIAAGSITTAMLATGAVTNAKVSYEVVSISITAGNSSNTGTATSGSVIIGFYPDTNCDQIVKNISISGTTVTVNLLNNSTGTSTIKVVLLKSV